MHKKSTNTLIAVIVTSFITTFNGSSLNLSIPGISADFGVSAQAIGWIVTIYTLCNVALALPFGKLSDLIGRVKVFRAGILVFLIGLILNGIATSFYAVLFYRLLQGVGSSMIFATSNAILVDAFDSNERGRALGYSVCSTYIGLSAGPVIGGLVNGYWGWRAVMFVTAGFSLIALVISFWKLSIDKPKWNKHHTDLPGLLLYVFGITSLMYGLSKIGTNNFSFILIILGIIVLALFISREKYCENNSLESIIKISLFKNLNFSFSNLAALMNYAATYAVSYYMSIYLQLVRGYSSQIAGLILISTPIVQAVLSPYAGKLSDKYSPYKISSLGMGCCAGALLLLVFVNERTPLYVVIPELALIGLGFALFSSPNTNAIMSAAGPADAGVASSTVATMRNCGQTISMAIITIIIGIVIGNVSINDADINSIVSCMHIIFIVFCIICSIGIFISLRRGDNK